MKNKRGPSIRGFVQFLEIGETFKEFCKALYEDSISEYDSGQFTIIAQVLVFILFVNFIFIVGIAKWLNNMLFFLVFPFIVVSIIEVVYLIYLGKFYSEHENE